MQRSFVAIAGKALITLQNAAVSMIALRVLLLVGLILSGTVPQGMMRTASADGMQLVLCTPEGPKEVWMGADGDIRDTQPTSDEPHSAPKCLSVALAMVGLQFWLGALAEPASFATFRPETNELAIVHSSAAAAHRPRAPPVLI